MPRRDKGGTVGTRSASHIENRTPRREIIEDKTQHLDSGFLHWWARAVNVFTVKQFALRWEKHFAKIPFLETSWYEAHQYLSN